MTTSLEMILIGGIVDQLTKAGSWCAETHVQKTAYVAKTVKGLPLESEFILYKHGPYSFDLNKSLIHMTARGIVTLERRGNYGPSYRVNEPMWRALDRASQNAFANVSAVVENVCRKLANKNVAELERFSTAIYVNKNFTGLSKSDKTKKFVELKPHVSQELAQAAFAEVEESFQ